MTTSPLHNEYLFWQKVIPSIAITCRQKDFIQSVSELWDLAYRSHETLKYHYLESLPRYENKLADRKRGGVYERRIANVLHQHHARARRIIKRWLDKNQDLFTHQEREGFEIILIKLNRKKSIRY